MKIKKLVAAGLTCAMAFSLSVPAFAADGDENTLTIGSEVQPAIIELTLPADIDNIVINPYGLEVGDDGSTEQIIFAPVAIENAGETAVAVSVSVTGTIESGSNATFATAQLSGASKSTKNDIWLYAQFGAPAADADTAILEDAFTAEYDKNKDIVVGTKAVSKASAFNLTAAGGETPAVGFRLAGEANGKAATPWAETDTVSVAVVFTAVPTVLS